MDYEGLTPLDLPRLRQWIGQLIGNYDALVSRGDIGYSQWGDEAVPGGPDLHRPGLRRGSSSAR